MMGEAVGTDKAVEIIDIYTHKVEKRLDKLGTYLVFIVTPLLLIIGMQLGTLIIYPFSQNYRIKKKSFLYFTRLQLMG